MLADDSRRVVVGHTFHRLPPPPCTTIKRKRDKRVGLLTIMLPPNTHQAVINADAALIVHYEYMRVHRYRSLIFDLRTIVDCCAGVDWIDHFSLAPPTFVNTFLKMMWLHWSLVWLSISCIRAPSIATRYKQLQNSPEKHLKRADKSGRS
jgi:hypothetical protein